jgi:hypothetical protein
MSIPDETANELLVKCGRHCCICRRFEPLHLHIHHIIEKSEGGSDDPDNLIPVCLTCHSDVHTHTKLTRRFTIDELKGHRNTVIQMVAEGKLVSKNTDNDDADELINEFIKSLFGKANSFDSDIQLPPHAVKILLDAARQRGVIEDLSAFITGDTDLEDMREISERKDAIDTLVSAGLLDFGSDCLYRVSHKGFLLADRLIALSDTTEKK